MNEYTDIDGLAAEYVLGSLPPAERKAVAQRLLTDKALATAVAAWQSRLAPLSLLEPGLPPPQALEGILAEITRQSLAGQTGETVLAMRRVRHWRLATASLAAASVVLAIMLGTRPQSSPSSGNPLVAVLAKGFDTSAADEPSTSTNPAFVATLDPGAATLTIRQLVGRRPPVERAYAVWLMARDGAPAEPIGVLSRTEPETQLRLSARLLPAMANGTLAVSSESGPAAQSPTGPILAIGKIEPTRR